MDEFKVLDVLLADLAVCAQNVKARHWTLTGDHFEGWHPFLDEVYKRLQKAVDAVAEIIVQRGGIPVHTMAGYVGLADILEMETIGTWERYVSETAYELFHIIEYINSYDRDGAWDAAASNSLSAIADDLYHYLMFCRQSLK